MIPYRRENVTRVPLSAPYWVAFWNEEALFGASTKYGDCPQWGVE